MNSKPTTYKERFTQALTLLCGGKAPLERDVDMWLNEESFKSEGDRFGRVSLHDPLQDWACSNMALDWMMGITLIEAAMILAASPEEGVGHEP